MSGKNPKWLLWPAVWIGVAACADFRVDTQQQAWADHDRECPHDPREGQDSLAIRSAVEPLVGDLLAIPEYHDCQRFIVLDPESGELVYDSVFAIYVTRTFVGDREALDSIFRLSLETGSELRETGPGAALRDVAIFLAQAVGMGKTWTVIHAKGDYDNLGIKTGANCLYVYGVAGGSWGAKMVPLDENPSLDCSQDKSPQELEDLQGTTLLVNTTALDDGETYTPADIPPVARWEWDSTPGNPQQYIGIACGRQWCEVGNPNGFTPTPPHAAPAGQSTKERRTRRIKGWYDEQILSENVGPDMLPRPTGVVGTIFPHPQLKTFKIDTHYRGKWVLVAEVALSGDPGNASTYKDKLNFDHAPPAPFGEGTMNRIFICRGGTWICIRSPEAIGVPSGDALNNGGGNQAGHFETVVERPWLPSALLIRFRLRKCDSGWVARIHSAGGGRPAYRCVNRNPRDDGKMEISVPATARWHWLDEETTWDECDEGCCEVECLDCQA